MFFKLTVDTGWFVALALSNWYCPSTPPIVKMGQHTDLKFKVLFDCFGGYDSFDQYDF